MGAYRFAGFYPAQFNTPLGSAIVAPGRVVEWPDGPPNEGHGWVETDEEPTPFEELGPVPDEEESEDAPTEGESTEDSGEKAPDNTPATDTPTSTDTAEDEKPADNVSSQVTEPPIEDTNDQPEPPPAPGKRSNRTNR